MCTFLRNTTAAMVPPMEDLGIRVLLNETISYARGGEALHVTGVDDVHRFHTEDARVALESAPEGFCIALVHSPEVAHVAAARHRLYLTGHTHGGQIVIPGNGAIAKGRLPVIAGLGRRDNTRLFVSRGIGTVYVPARINCPPEEALVTLVRQSAN